ncbi:MAG: helix-turn-helix domain-containing protein [Anaerolineae bacterium]|nr:helix-turn-helix domain-containing protein [Thermoflexales bacterium]MDW8407275.1 helix-turn-helix domain-containing protein [Anaerolineae bacterium]
MQTVKSEADGVALESVRSRYQALAEAYASAWGLPCVLADLNGQVIEGSGECPAACAVHAECIAARQRAIQESARWGEPFILLCPQDNLLWAVPVMDNMRVVGGLIAATRTPTPDHSAGALPVKVIREAVAGLQALAVELNLTNAAYLELQRLAAQRESERARAIHQLKNHTYQTIREVYLVEEPALISAVKQGDRRTARGILNRVLVGIYFLGRDRPALLKSLLLELVVMMSRSAVEAGADPSELLGANYSSLAALAGIEGEEALTTWLVAMLERIMDAINANPQYPISVMLGKAIQYMQEHLHEDLSRDEVARVACLSPSHFSRVVKHTFGQSFTDLLTHMRVDRAKELLIRSEKSLIQICLECGFNDQSYFTKVFQKVTGYTPGEFRRRQRAL